MKSISPLILTVIFGLTLLLSACNKDDDSGLDNIIGSWIANDGTVVATVAGVEVYNGDMTASGTMTFNADSTGRLTLQLAFDNSTSSLNGSFNWLRSSNIITSNQGTPDELKFTRIKNEKNLQELTFTQEVSSDNAVLDYVLRIRRQ